MVHFYEWSLGLSAYPTAGYVDKIVWFGQRINVSKGKSHGA